MKDLKKLLKPGERLDLSGQPWPVPKIGDLLRAEMLFDTDPASSSHGSLRRMIGTAEIYGVDKSVGSPGDMLVYWHDAENHPVPESLSHSEWGPQRNWGGCEYWGPVRMPKNCIPLYAIKEGILSSYARLLATRSERADKGIYA